jgi:hypothetical protein
LFWRRIERLVVANWTGILGVVMVVAGVSFVTINMALTMGPQARFWLTVAAAAVLVLPSLLWGQRDPWQNLTAWMRSGGAALFLFACSAAGGVPDLGLTWQRDPGGALALLVLGGLANLLVAVIARNQTIAALHGVLTLVPLMIASPSGLTLGLGSLVGMVSLLLPRRRPWHGQRLAASLAYGWFQLTWVAHSGQALELASPGGPSLRWLAAGAAIAVFGCGALLPHLGQERAFPGQSKSPTPVAAPAAAEGITEAGAPPGAAKAALPLQLLGLLSNWSGLGLALFLYPQSPGLRFGGLVLAWAAATVLSRRTPLSSRPWLGRCDTLAAQTLAIAALLSLLGPIANGPLLVFALFVEAVLFVRLGLDRTDPWIGVMGWGLVNLGGFGLLLTVLAQGAAPGQGALVAGANALAIAQQNRVLFLVAAAMTIAVQVQLHPRTALPRDPADEAQPAEVQAAKVLPVQALPIPALLGWLAAALAFGAAWCCSPAGWQEPVALASLGPLLLLARRRPLPGLVSGTSTAILLSHGTSWIGWASLAPLNSLAAQASQFLPHLLPLLALGLVMAASTRGSQRRGAILLIGFTAALGAFRLLAPLPLLALGGTWLALALVALLIAPRLPRQEAGCVLGLGLLDLVGASAIAFIEHPSGNTSPITLLLLAASALTVAYGRHISRLDLVAPMAPLLGWLAAALAFSAAWWGGPAGWQELVALLGLGALLILSKRQPLPGLAAGTFTAIVVSHGISWVSLLGSLPDQASLGSLAAHASQLLRHLLPLLALALVMAANTKGRQRLWAIQLIGCTATLGVFWLLAPLSPLALAGALLGLALLALLIAPRLPRKEASCVLGLGLIALVAASAIGIDHQGNGLVVGLLNLVGANPIGIDQAPHNPSQGTVAVLAASALTVAYGRQVSQLEWKGPIGPLLGWLAAALAFWAAWWGAPASWQEPVALLGLGPLLLLSKRRPQPGLANASATALVVSHGISWVGLLTGQPWPGAMLWPHLLGLLGLGVVLAFGTTGNLVLLAIDLFGVSTGLGAFLVVAPLSPLAPAMAWLGLSLLALGAANRLGQEKTTHALILGLSALLIAGIWGLAEGAPGPELQLLGGLAIPARLMVDLAGLGVVLVWWRWPASARLAQNRLWRALRPWLVEALLGGILITVALEVSAPWQQVAWSGLALALLSPAMGRLLAPRIKLYSVLIQWLAIAVVVTGSLPPEAGWQQSNSGPIGLMAITIQVLYVVASHRWLVLAGPNDVPSGALAHFAAALKHHRNRALYYPLFLGIALDLASRYDHSLLTLLWATEAFILFGLSALLRENQFRYLALGGLGGCLLRLVAVDMRQADMGLRGLVFIGVGLLMLAMNALYNRFRSRFEEGNS